MVDRKIIIVLVGVIGLSLGFSRPAAAQNLADGKEGVSVQKVSFPNGNITVVGNVFKPASFDMTSLPQVRVP